MVLAPLMVTLALAAASENRVELANGTPRDLAMLVGGTITGTTAVGKVDHRITLPSWPSRCNGQRVYPLGCSVTAANCVGYWLDGVWYPAKGCNTETCRYQCADGFVFEIKREI